VLLIAVVPQIRSVCSTTLWFIQLL